MTGSLIERVRERLASESGPLRPSVVAAAIRAESGGMLGDTEVLANLRVLQTELTGAGILEPLLSADGTTDVLVTAPDSVWVDDGNGLRPARFGLLTSQRCEGWHNGWLWRPAVGSTTRNPGWTVN